MGQAMRRPLMPESKTVVLDLGGERILRWLHRYPFQRVQDLVVALSPWEKRGAVYRRIAELEEQQLIEACGLGSSTLGGGKRLYHLSPAGLLACAVDPVSQASERDKLIRLFPRLPILLLVQDLVNGLVSGSPIALARSGQTPSLVRWNWLRDYTHPFVKPGQGKHTLNLRVEGALALCLRFPKDARLPTNMWHTLLIWHCPLDDARLLRSRFDRLLRWRESAERQPISSQMPPILILASNARQAELWQLACAQMAARLRVEAPVGAVANWEDHKQAPDGWRLPWRRLGTDAFCRLPELVQPASAPSLTDLLETHTPGRREAKREADPVGSVPVHRRSFSLSSLVARSTQSDDYRLVSLRLIPRQWEILRLCFAHPLLSRSNLSAYLSLCPKFVQILLAELRTLSYLTSTQTLAGERWHLADAGLRLLARAANCHVRRLVHTPIEEGQPLQQRGLLGLLHQVRHTAGIYGFFADLSKSLSQQSCGQLCWWESGASCERVFVYREETFHFKPDALACVRIGERSWRFWLEWDRGTMGVRDLESKWATYAAYLTSREWAKGGGIPPRLLCVVPEIAQERRLQSVACALLAHLPSIHLYTTTASLMMRQGILAPIWQKVVLQRKPTFSEPSQRVALFTEG
jgi:hypothetical protein